MTLNAEDPRKTGAPITYVEHAARRCGDPLALAIIAARDEGDSPDLRTVEEWERLEADVMPIQAQPLPISPPLLELLVQMREREQGLLISELARFSDALSGTSSKALILRAINAIEGKL